VNNASEKVTSLDRVRWVYVVDVYGNVETNFRDEPEHCPTLKVEILSVGPTDVEERTWTYNRKYRWGDSHPEILSVRPLGQDWSFEHDDGQSTTWTRRRDRRTALIWYEQLTEKRRSAERRGRKGGMVP
jgi:hypothetical protein